MNYSAIEKIELHFETLFNIRNNCKTLQDSQSGVSYTYINIAIPDTAGIMEMANAIPDKDQNTLWSFDAAGLLVASLGRF